MPAAARYQIVSSMEAVCMEPSTIPVLPAQPDGQELKVKLAFLRIVLSTTAAQAS